MQNFAIFSLTASCVCEDDTGECIMHDTLSIPPSTTWSSCSVETLFTSLGGPLGLCLGNAPVTTVSDATCGNGIQEKGEACDCGSAEVQEHIPLNILALLELGVIVEIVSLC